MVSLDIRNSRMKDFFDLWAMSRTVPFDLEPLRRAIVSTFERRSTRLPIDTPFALAVALLSGEPWQGS